MERRAREARGYDTIENVYQCGGVESMFGRLNVDRDVLAMDQS